MRRNEAKAKIAAGGTVLAGWAGIGDPYAAEVLGHAGFDAVIVDLQHGMLDAHRAIGMMQALSSTPAVPMARVSGNDFAEIQKVLDGGAYGVIVPLVDSPDDARRLVEAVRYPPRGRRSHGPARGLLYGGPDYVANADGEILALAMIETPAGLEAVEAIAAVPGLDGLFVGPADLSFALGQRPPPRWRDEPVAGALARILRAARSNGRIAGIFCTAVEMAEDMRDAGWNLIMPGADVALLRGAAQAACARLRGTGGAGATGAAAAGGAPGPAGTAPGGY